MKLPKLRLSVWLIIGVVFVCSGAGIGIGYFSHSEEVIVEVKEVTYEVPVAPLSRTEINDWILKNKTAGTLDTVVHFYAALFPEKVRIRPVPVFDDRNDRILRVLYDRAIRNNWTAEEFKQFQADRHLFGPKSRVVYAYLQKKEHIEDSRLNRFELTYLIVSAAELYNIPVNILMAVVMAESMGDPMAVNKHNGNGSNDVGLMQLNSRVFEKIDRYDPRENLKYGCQHLKTMYNQYGTWEEAIMYYNGFGPSAAKHQAKVLAKERELNRKIYQWRLENAA